MCGIAGIIDAMLEPDELQRRLETMQCRLRHRGPDDSGLFLDPAAGMGLAHTRLSILDLTDAAHQPMSDPQGRYTIVYNGEIYNFRELRDELTREGVHFRSTSDTEVILECYRRFGDDCPRRFVGMFAFAIWDSLERRCFLARGPMGIKPLYFWAKGESLAFASEVRALLAADFESLQLCPRALRGYFLYGTVQEPLTLVEGIEMLPAGHRMVWQDGAITICRFADLSFGTESAEPLDAVVIASDALASSVDRHFVSDAPVSLFLSGGFDSTAILALARRNGRENLRTFSISFENPDYDEGELAARTAAHFGTEHYDWRMTAEDGRRLFGRFLDDFDQPSNDGFNTYCVSKLAHDHGAKVVLSGLGGDELFGGYPSFEMVPKMLHWHARLRAFPRLRRWAGSQVEHRAHQPRWRRAGAYLQSNGGAAAAYWAMRGAFAPVEAERLVAYYLDAERVGFADGSFGAEPPDLPTEKDRVSFLEATRYMQNQLLRDSDVMSMAWGLELRVPFVDRVLYEQVCRLPAEARLAPGKSLIPKAVPEIPEWIASSPKRGFSFPFEEWLGDEWGHLFQETDRRSPVRLGSWYRRWMLFTLDHFLKTNGIGAKLLAA